MNKILFFTIFLSSFNAFSAEQAEQKSSTESNPFGLTVDVNLEQNTQAQSSGKSCSPISQMSELISIDKIDSPSPYTTETEVEFFGKPLEQFGQPESENDPFWAPAENAVQVLPQISYPDASGSAKAAPAAAQDPKILETCSMGEDIFQSNPPSKKGREQHLDESAAKQPVNKQADEKEKQASAFKRFLDALKKDELHLALVAMISAYVGYNDITKVEKETLLPLIAYIAWPYLKLLFLEDEHSVGYASRKSSRLEVSAFALALATFANPKLRHTLVK